MAAEITMMPRGSITPYENNPRFNDGAVDAVAASISAFGFRNPIIVDKDLVIIAGHTRLKAAEKLGIREVPVIIADDLSEEQARAYRLADNKVAELAEWDYEALGVELQSITGIDMDVFGFGEFEDISYAETEDEVEEPSTPDPPEEPETNPGDLYILGNHRLLCGDSMNEDDVDELLDGHKADMVFTDPPYGVKYENKKNEKIMNDDIFLDVCPELKDRCTGWVFVCTTWRVLEPWMAMFKESFDMTNMVIWAKGGGGMGDTVHTLSTDYEIMLVANQGKEVTGKRIGSFWDFDTTDIATMKKEELVEILQEIRAYNSAWRIGKDAICDYMHPTQKPVALPAKALRVCTKVGDRVLDLFGGSGSTMLACEQMGRINYSMEMDPKYCDVIVHRWEALTGGKAVRIPKEERA